MKTTYLCSFCCLLVLTFGSLTAKGQIKDYCLGEWNFICPDALDGSGIGTIKITNDSVYTEYPGKQYGFSSKRAEYLNNTLCFYVNINGQQIICEIKPEDRDILSGNLVTDYGSFPIILIKEGKRYKNHSSGSDPGLLPVTKLSWIQEQKPTRTTVQSGLQNP